MVHAKNDRKFNKAYKMLLKILDEYNVNLLSTKIYWEKPNDREEYKKFWEEYKKIDKIEDEKEKELKKEILYVKKDLKQLLKEEKRYNLVIKEYKEKLVELGAMKTIKNTCKTLNGEFSKGSKKKKAKKAKTVKTETKQVKRGRPKKSETEVKVAKRGRPRKTDVKEKK